VPRGTYQCADGKWVGLSASADSVAARVLQLLGVADDPRFTTFTDRMAHREELEALMVEFCRTRTRPEVIAEFEAVDAAIGPVLDMADIAVDPHFAAREAIVQLEGTPMQGLIAKLSRTPGTLKWQGRPLDSDGADIRERGWGG
jgi:crotonobetainyl-CoA:carnitine CoA-transferase CaiB-like acyl-CoA transferase